AGVLSAAALSAAVLAAPLGAETPTLDQSLSLLSVRAPALSPDGRQVVYERQETDWKENAYVTQLFLADVASGRSTQLTRGKKSTASAEGSPAGRWIAFRAERELPAEPKEAGEGKEKKEGEAGKAAEGKPDARQIWLISPQGGEAWPLTAHG